MRKNIFSVFGSGNTYVPIGSDEEKKKRDLLYEMYRLICKSYNLKPLSEFYMSNPGIRLAVANIGTSYDEEIQITLKFPKEAIVSLEKIPTPEGLLLEDINKIIDDLYGIPKTPNYEAYPFRYPFMHLMSDSGGHNHKELLDCYSSKLEYLFDYDFFQEDNDDVIQIEYKSINQHIAFAFPMVLFLSRIIESVDYTIRSKHTPNIVEGTLSIEIGECLRTKEIQNL